MLVPCRVIFLRNWLRQVHVVGISSVFFFPSVQVLQKHWPRKNQDAICQEMFGEPREKNNNNNNNNKMAAQNCEERKILLFFFVVWKITVCYSFLCFALPLIYVSHGFILLLFL